MSRGRLSVVLIIAFLPGIVLAPVWRNVGLGAGEDDILYYYPMRALMGWFDRSGEPPLLNPFTGCGRPYLADPQTAVFYPATWLFVGLPADVAYPLSLWLHYSLALIGAYRLIRTCGCGRTAALFGAMAFAVGGFMVTHRAHFAMQHAAAWAPFVLWRLQRYRQVGDWFDGTRLSLAVIAIAFQCLAGHVQVAALTALAALVLTLADTTGQPVIVRVRRLLLPWLMGGAIFAVQWVPTLIYTGVCDRGDRTYWDFVENSLHPGSLIAFVLPMLLGQRTPNFFAQPYWGASHQVEQLAYIGIAPLVLAALAILAGGWRDARRRPWIALGAVALLVALGRYGPICPLIYWLPGAGLFRCPARALLLVNLAVAVLAAQALQRLIAPPNADRAEFRYRAKRWLRRPAIVASSLVLLPLALLVTTLPLLSPPTRTAALTALTPSNPAIWIPLVFAIASVLLLANGVRRWDRPGRVKWLLPVLVLDLAVVGWTLDVPADKAGAAALTSPRDVAWMEPVRVSGRRLWVVTGRVTPASLPGEYVDSLNKLVANTNILSGIRLLTDYGPLQPREFAGWFCFKPWGESTCASDLLHETSWVSLYDVGWILLCEPDLPPPAGFTLHTTTRHGFRLYRDDGFRVSAALAGAPTAAQIRYVAVGASGFQIEVQPMTSVAVEDEPSGPEAQTCRLVVSIAAVPGWDLVVNGSRAAALNVDGLLAVEIPADEPVLLVGQYTPAGLLLGLRISLVATVALLVANIVGIVAAARRIAAGRSQEVPTVPG